MLHWFLEVHAQRQSLPGLVQKNHINIGNSFYVGREYRRLKAVMRKRMSIFTRSFHSDVYLPYQDTQIKTTMEQLHFLRWAANHGVIQYVENHQQEIQEAHMAHYALFIQARRTNKK